MAVDRYGTNLHEDKAALDRQLKKLRYNLRAIQERKREYVQQTDIPLQLGKDEKEISDSISTTEKAISLINSANAALEQDQLDHAEDHLQSLLNLALGLELPDVKQLHQQIQDELQARNLPDQAQNLQTLEPNESVVEPRAPDPGGGEPPGPPPPTPPQPVTPHLPKNTRYPAVQRSTVLGIGTGFLLVSIVFGAFFIVIPCVIAYRITEFITVMVVLLISGVGLTYLSIRPQRNRRFAWSLCGGASVALIGLVVTTGFWPGLSKQRCDAAVTISSPDSAMSTPAIQISSPLPDQEVPYVTHITGTVTGPITNRDLWSIVESIPEPKDYWLVPITVTESGAWETVVKVGRNLGAELGKTYSITVILADVETSQRLSQIGKDHWTPLDDGVVRNALTSTTVQVRRTNPILTFDSHASESRVVRSEVMSGRYSNLTPGAWHLYGIVQYSETELMPFGPFTPETASGTWAIPVNIPWPPNGERVSFYVLAVLADTPTDNELHGAIGGRINQSDLSGEDVLNIYDQHLAEKTFVRSERVAFASDQPANDDIFVIDSNGTGLKRLTENAMIDTDAAWSPDGKQIVFASNRSGEFQLYVMDTDGQNERQLYAAPAIQMRHPAWSPDGKWIAFVTQKGPGTIVYKISVSGEELTPLATVSGAGFYPVWSTDSTEITMLNQYPGIHDGRGNSYIVDVANKTFVECGITSPIRPPVRSQSPPGTPESILSPIWRAITTGVQWDCWSPEDIFHSVQQRSWKPLSHSAFAADNQQFVYAQVQNQISKLVIGSVQSGKGESLQVDLTAASSPAWNPTPGNERIAFTGRSNGDMEIFVMWNDGTGVRQLTDNSAGDIYPRVAPDGHRIVFASNRNGSYDLFVQSIDSPTDVRNLTENTPNSNELQPTWAPDGHQIAFISNRSGNYDLFAVNENGTGERQLTDGPAQDTLPAWSPSGDRLAFSSDRVVTNLTDIYVIAPTSTARPAAQPIASHAQLDSGPSWSPTGDHLAFVSARETNSDDAKGIYVMDWSTGLPISVTHSLGYEAYPLWSEDGRHLYFTSDQEAGRRAIWVYSQDTKATRKLTGDTYTATLGWP